jgi:hypothetical protein
MPCLVFSVWTYIWKSMTATEATRKIRTRVRNSKLGLQSPNIYSFSFKYTLFQNLLQIIESNSYYIQYWKLSQSQYFQAKMLRPESYCHCPNAHYTNFSDINVPNINFKCANAQLKNCYWRATATNVKDNLYKYNSILWLQHGNKLLFHDINYINWCVWTVVSIGWFVNW